MAQIPETRFARAGDVDIAYQVVGAGPIDLVWIPGWVSHCDLAWELPELARFLDRLAEFSRLIVFDKRGTGLSDRVPVVPTLEEKMEDLVAVLDAVGAERVAIVGWADGAAIGAMFAATYPDRVSVLVMGSASGGGVRNEDGVPGVDPAFADEMAAAIATQWGEAAMLGVFAPSAVDDPRFVAFWRRYERSSATPNAAAALFRSILEIDIRGVLPSVHAPVLVIQRRDALIVSAAGSRWLTDHLPDGRYLELPGADTLPYVGDRDAILDAIQEFVTGSTGRSGRDRVLATVLFTDIVGSTELADELGDEAWRDLLDGHHAAVRRAIARFDGAERNTMGDGFVVTFDGPARAVRCARAASEAVHPLGLRIRTGLHTGEVELRADDLSGIAVHVGARVCALAGADETLVTSVVKDLVLGSGITFEPAGTHVLKGVPGEWPLHRVLD